MLGRGWVVFWGFCWDLGCLVGFLGSNRGQKLWRWGKKVIAGGKFDDYDRRFGYKDFSKRLPKLSFEVLKMALTGLVNRAE